MPAASATLACFGVVCTYGFTNAEDVALITSNGNFNPPTLRGLRNHWREPHLYLYIPVTYTVWRAVAQVARREPSPPSHSPLDPRAFHALNLIDVRTGPPPSLRRGHRASAVARGNSRRPPSSVHVDEPRSRERMLTTRP